MVQIMENHMTSLKKAANKGQMMEDSVFLVNSYYLLIKCLAHIRVRNSQPFYSELFKYSS